MHCVQLVGNHIAHADTRIEGLDIEIDDAAGRFDDKVNAWMRRGEVGKPRAQAGRGEQRKDLEPQSLTPRSASYGWNTPCQLGKGTPGCGRKGSPICCRIDGPMSANKKLYTQRILQ